MTAPLLETMARAAYDAMRSTVSWQFIGASRKQALAQAQQAALTAAAPELAERVERWLDESGWLGGEMRHEWREDLRRAITGEQG